MSTSRHLTAVEPLSPALALDVPDTFVEAVAVRVAALLEEREPKPPTVEPWLDVADAAEHLACGRRRVYDLVSQRRVPFTKDGSRLLFKASELDAAMRREA